MDFFQIRTKEVRGGALEIYPDFVVGRSKDLMVRGKSFYAIWDPEKGLWSQDEYDVQRLVDKDLHAYAEEHGIDRVKSVRLTGSGSWYQFKKFLQNSPDNSKQLDTKLIFANTEVKKEDYASRRLPYELAPGDHSAWDGIVGTLYPPEERAKIEWAIGAVISGDSKTKKIDKFLVFYGAPGTGKGTILEIILDLFQGYTTTFDAKALVGNNNAFATEAFKDNPLVAVQLDGDLSNIHDNTKLNMIISKEEMRLNEKYKPTYSARIHSFLFMGSNSPVKITDSKSGLIRRLIDVNPSGDLLSPEIYHQLMARVKFELGAIAQHCLDVYQEMGRTYYNSYRPDNMMYQTNAFFNFIEAHYELFSRQDGGSLKQIYKLYKDYCEETGVEKPMPQTKVRGELSSYFKEFHERITIDGVTIRSYYSKFTASPFKTVAKGDMKKFSLMVEETTSLLDQELADCPAQGFKLNADGNEVPKRSWSEVSTTLAEIDTSETHFVKLPENHIVIDFDLTDKNGKKSLALNLEAASEWPPTYAEISKGGNGIHLHYIYDGDVTQLAQKYSEGIEVKTLLGLASLRRRLTKCNNVEIATISSGLPFKEKKVLDVNTIRSEKSLRNLIERNLRKEIHPGTKPSVDFIFKILQDAYDSGMQYNLEDMRPAVMAFANNSSNQRMESLRVFKRMKWKSEEVAESSKVEPASHREVAFDVEVYPNLFVICWGYVDDDVVVPMINPTPQEVEDLFRFKLTGFYNRNYDNHITYGRFMGYTNAHLYELSKKIVEGNSGARFGEAYNISYADLYDIATKKQGLKKWMYDLGLPHMEMDLPWDQPVPDDRIMDVVNYCINDVKATKAVRKAINLDFLAREILADLSGLTVNDPNPKHAARIIFGKERNPQREFVYTDLSKEFPGYKYDFGKSTYRGEDPSEGGYVYAETGYYEDVAVLDVASMHPSSIRALNLFGPYTERFGEIMDARLSIKHGDFDAAGEMLSGRLKPYLKDIRELGDPREQKVAAKVLGDALKLTINTVYGLTSAKFDNPFRDIRNKDNIVAKRGALFMIDLKKFVQESGFPVVHIKTDSIKIPGATPWLIEEIMEFGRKYQYEFEHETTYKKFCLVNDAVYIAKDYGGKWDATGAQFQHPYVFKTLFSHEPVLFDDMCEIKSVNKGALFLDFTLGEGERKEKDYEGLHFVGKVGQFTPVKDGYGGGILYRMHEDKPYAATGSKGYRWLESSVAREIGEECIDTSYYERLADAARKNLEETGGISLADFVSDEMMHPKSGSSSPALAAG